MRFWMRCRMSAGDAGGDARRLLNTLLGDAVRMDEVLLFSMCVRAVKLRWVLIVSVTKFRSSELRKKDNNAMIANILQRNQTMRIKQTQYIKGPKQIYFEVDRLTRKSSLQVQPKTQICKTSRPSIHALNASSQAVRAALVCPESPDCASPTCCGSRSSSNYPSDHSAHKYNPYYFSNPSEASQDTI